MSMREEALHHRCTAGHPHHLHFHVACRFTQSHRIVMCWVASAVAPRSRYDDDLRTSEAASLASALSQVSRTGVAGAENLSTDELSTLINALQRKQQSLAGSSDAVSAGVGSTRAPGYDRGKHCYFSYIHVYKYLSNPFSFFSCQWVYVLVLCRFPGSCTGSCTAHVVDLTCCSYTSFPVLLHTKSLVYVVHVASQHQAT